jgi:DMSO/TMAO reductase YedYZ molybdopterin-dependent catalytic subunit
MKERRNFLRKVLGGLLLSKLWIDPIAFASSIVRGAGKKRILPKETKLNTLVGSDPALLDTRNLDITPVEKFGTMGLDNHETDLEKWRLKVEGNVERKLSLKYAKVRDMPSLERDVLLICPGIFALNGRWKGISISELLTKSGLKKDVKYVTIYGPEGNYQKVARFPIEDVKNYKLFLAYDVNGKPLPRKHGFPLRLVAEGVYGTDWVKYVYKITADS